MSYRRLCVRCCRPLTDDKVSGYCDDCDDGKDQIERLQDRIKDLEEAVCEFLDKLQKHGSANYERLKFLVGRR